MQIDELMATMAERGASAAHLVIGEQPVIRVGGVLERVDSPPIPPTLMDMVLIRNLTDVQRTNLAQSGYIDLSLSHGVTRFVCRIYHQRGQVAATLRRISSDVPTLETVASLPEERTRLGQLMQFRKGLILVAGSGGSGRTWLSSALIDHVNHHANKRIATIEDPVEFDFRPDKCLITQQLVGHDVESVEAGVKAAQALDADIVYISEIADYATLHAAINLAERGQIVVSTIEFPTVATTIRGLFDAYSASHPQLREKLSQTLQAIVSTRLIPTANLRGRVAAFEIMIASLKIRAVIGEGRWEFGQLVKDGRKMGMQTLDDSLVALCKAGTITLEEAQHRISDKTALNELR
ncbi:MAG TPA: ATPase, T2SS/T4P/T4SS family [Capsulimonadaceae bacterium]